MQLEANGNLEIYRLSGTVVRRRGRKRSCALHHVKGFEIENIATNVKHKINEFRTTIRT